MCIIEWIYKLMLWLFTTFFMTFSTLFLFYLVTKNDDNWHMIKKRKNDRCIYAGKWDNNETFFGLIQLLNSQAHIHKLDKRR